MTSALMTPEEFEADIRALADQLGLTPEQATQAVAMYMGRKPATREQYLIDTCGRKFDPEVGYNSYKDALMSDTPAKGLPKPRGVK